MRSTPRDVRPLVSITGCFMYLTLAATVSRARSSLTCRRGGKRGPLIPYADSAPGATTVIAAVLLALTCASGGCTTPDGSQGPVIGYVADANAEADRLATFRQRLKELGYVEERNIVIEFRLAERPEDYPKLVADLITGLWTCCLLEMQRQPARHASLRPRCRS